MANNDLITYKNSNLLYLYISHLSITNYDIERTDFEAWGFQDIDKCDSNMTIWLINLIKLIKKQWLILIHLGFVAKIEFKIICDINPPSPLYILYESTHQL